MRMCFFGCISLARVFILRVTEFSLSSYRSLYFLVLLGGGFTTNMSDSEHPSDGATESVPPIQHSSQFDTVFELFKGYVDSRLHELSTASASNTESSKSANLSPKRRNSAERPKLLSLRRRGISGSFSSTLNSSTR